MKKISVILTLLILLFSIASLNSCIEKTPDYQIVVNATNNVQVTDQGFVVEADNTITIPQGEVYDKDGNYCEDFQISRVITDGSGNRKAGTLQMKHGEVYTVTYTATNGEIELTKEMKLYAYDTMLPTITLMNIQKMYSVGETVTIKVNGISNDVDYTNSTIVLKNVTANSSTPLSFTEAYSFVAENESETYKIVATLKDVNGNSQTLEYDFIIAGNFKDSDISKNEIWDFEELGYANNLKLSGESDDLVYSIETSGLPADTNSIGIGNGALKLNLKADERYVFTLVNGNEFKIEDCSAIGFRLWATEVIDIFEIYNADDNAMHDLSWKATKRGVWQNVTFDPLGAFSSEYSFDSVKIVISCEEDVTVYIDSIYYIDYVEPWRDGDIPKGELAIFDDAGYLERVSEALNIDSTTFGGSWEIVTSIPGTTDFTGGALKFISTSDASLTSDKNARDGFKFQFFDKISYDDIEGFIIRLYCVDPQGSLAINFVDQKLGETAAEWFTLQGAAGQWVNVIIPKEDVAHLIDGYKNITHINIRFIRPASSSVEGQEEYITYVDKISLYGLDYDNVDYTFTDDYDMRAVENINYTTGVRVEDENANDGWALHGTTGFHASGSGLKINFNHLDLSLYSSIYIRIRTTYNNHESSNTNAVTIYGNGTDYDLQGLKYGGFESYTTLDVLPKLLSNGETYLDYILIARTTAQGIGIYIDEIVFVEKADAPVYEDFTLNASQLQQFVGTDGYGNFEGGNISNIADGSVNVGTYQGKDNVLTFNTVAHVNEGATQNYSGGGMYIDFSEYIASGKIIVAQDFTINISIYLPSGTGHRVGAVYGDNLEFCSWKNLWKNPFDASKGAGWYTITITSAELRGLSGCADAEIKGIYLGVVPVGYTCGIESLSVTFNNAD